MKIENSTQLRKALENIAIEAINVVSKDISDNNVLRPDNATSLEMGYLKRIIWEKTYTFDYFPNVVYYSKNIETGERGNAMPTFQFFRAFKWRKIDKNSDGISRELFYDWKSMQYDPSTFLHGDPKRGDMREELADILNVDGTSAGYFQVKKRKPFWDITISEVNSSIKVLFDAALWKYI
jgi:hypothetical protein